MILMYHKVDLEAPTEWWVDLDRFYWHLHALRNKRVVYLEDYDPSDPEQVVITFDGIYRNIRRFAGPLLQRFGYPFELFLTSDYVGRDNAFDTVEPLAEFADMQELRELVEMGGRLQWHTRSHMNLKEVQDPEVISNELDVPSQLRELDPKGFRWFAYPNGEFNESVLAAVTERFEGAVSCIQGNDHDRFLLNRVTATNELDLRGAKVSVVIASYNYGSYLVEAVESALRQTVPADEILISDDASDDDTWEIAQQYEKQFPEKIRANRNEKNLGIIDHFNKAVRMTVGDYVCVLGADNRLRSDFLERASTALDAAERAAVAYTDFALFGSRADIVADDFKGRWPVEDVCGKYHVVRFPDFDDQTRNLLGQQNFIHGTSLFRRASFDEVGGYMADPDVPEDHGLFRRMIQAGWDAIHVGKPLLEYRQHSREQANVRAGSAALQQHYRKEIAALKAYIDQTHKSVSWKLSAPLRVAEHSVRKWISNRGRKS